MRWWILSPTLLVLLGGGCARSFGPALMPGDIVRPEIAFAPQEPWPSGAAVAIGMLIRIERKGSEGRYLDDTEVRELPEMQSRVTFFDGDRTLGDPMVLPFVRDC